jgi:hypothetical protein
MELTITTHLANERRIEHQYENSFFILEMKKESTSTMSNFSPNGVPNGFDGSFSFAHFHPKKQTQSRASLTFLLH